MSEPEDAAGAASGGTPEEPPKKKLSPIERIRAQAAAKSSASAEQAGGGSEPAREAKEQEAKPSSPAKPSSKLEAIRAAAAGAKKPVATEQTDAGKAEAPPGSAAEIKERPSRPVPPKPVKPKPSEPAAGSSRRRFFSWAIAAWASFSAGCATAVLAGVRFLYPNVLQEPPNIFKVGPPDKFEEGNVYEQWKNEYGVWIVRDGGTLFAIRTVCTHLGCTPNWLEAEQKFKCPCHGSGFRKTGVNFEGPAPRPLERYSIAMADDGQVQVDKSKKWQKELGQWTEENGALLKV